MTLSDQRLTTPKEGHLTGAGHGPELSLTTGGRVSIHRGSAEDQTTGSLPLITYHDSEGSHNVS